MSQTSEKILASIEGSKMHPHPRWKFVTKNIIFWFFFGLAVSISALSLSVILDTLISHDWDVYPYLNKSFLGFFFSSLPYLWIVCLAVFSWLAYFEFVHTKKWYSRKLFVVYSSSVVGGMVIGIIFLCSGAGHKMDQLFEDKLPYYGILNIDKKAIWCHPEQGLLGGVVDKRKDDEEGIIRITDCLGDEWIIQQVGPYMKVLKINTGDRIKIIGRDQGGRIFEVQEMRRW